jgi:hypothetical protein
MSGTDELFPGATEHGAPTESVPSRISGRPGLAAVVAGLAASAANISAALTGVATVVSQFGGSGDTTANIDWVPTFVLVALTAAGILGVVAVILGIRAISLRRGRGFGIAGAILGTLAVALDLTIAVVALLAVLSAAA